MYLVERDVPVEITDIRLVMNAVFGCTDGVACNFSADATLAVGMVRITC